MDMKEYHHTFSIFRPAPFEDYSELDRAFELRDAELDSMLKTDRNLEARMERQDQAEEFMRETNGKYPTQEQKERMAQVNLFRGK